MNRRDELDEMYVVIRKGCVGKLCTDCPGHGYDNCGDYNKVAMLYDAGWRKQVEAKWIQDQIFRRIYLCSNCKDSHRIERPTKLTPYCGNCGAKMKNPQLVTVEYDWGY